jgi:hypothetical protein
MQHKGYGVVAASAILLLIAVVPNLRTVSAQTDEQGSSSGVSTSSLETVRMEMTCGALQRLGSVHPDTGNVCLHGQCINIRQTHSLLLLL